MTQRSSLRGASATRQPRYLGRTAGLLRFARGAVIAALFLAIAAPALADSDMPPAYWANRQLPDPRQEAEAQALMDELRCLVCQGQSIADSDAELAGDMRDLVRRRIAEGQKPGEIRSWLISRYGDWISYKPTASGAALPLWLLPFALLLIGGLIVARRVRRTRP